MRRCGVVRPQALRQPDDARAQVRVSARRQSRPRRARSRRAPRRRRRSRGARVGRGGSRAAPAAAELAEGRADAAVGGRARPARAGGRGRRIGLVGVEAGGASRSRSGGTRWILRSGVRGKHVDELHGRSPHGGKAMPARRELARAARSSSPLPSSVRSSASSVLEVARAREAEAPHQLGEDLVVGARLAGRARPPARCGGCRTRRSRAQLAVLEEGRRRQHDVGVARGVGHHLLVDDREEVVAREPARARASGRASSRAGWRCRRRAP